MNKKEAEFSNLVKAFRKRHMGKGPREIRTTFCKQWAICEMEGNLSPVEKFIATGTDGKQVLRTARTEMVKDIYRNHPPIEMEQLLGAKFVELFVDIDLEKDFGMSIFVFDQDIESKFSLK
ncbi:MULTISPECIES: DUF2294 domain-containing protein [Paenibacillus]|jgi:uncharacterized protein YbcI|uniref:DUF2294 domain-containing protein n=1 Tax=Paenibacillus baimaensis TaxID=2982185 RepID=A0ABT2UJ20_9BACL|nr:MULTISPECIES: DUF2294 domain-containing protein [unclassified Paenibacillus]MCU6794639.1 DUF2294 domain-containing protein [Paenibacillus sp. WQ 127069]OMF19478.1 hypothetical protein BK127_05910 [Paenibacillus sp. FSL H7-0331]